MGAVARRSFTPSEPLGARRHKPDYWLIMLSAMMLAIGLVVVYAISPGLAVEKHVSDSFYVTRQAIAVALSVVAFGVTAFVPFERWKRWRSPLLVVAGLMTVIALVTPTNPDYPAHRWVRFGALSFQSVELLKFAVLIWLAALLSKMVQAGKIRDDFATLKPILICLGVVGVVVAFVQSDFGSMSVITVMVAAMVFVAGIPIKRLAMVALIVVTAGVLAISIVPYRRARIMAFLHEGSSVNCAQLQTGYQACRARVAVGSGGMIGLGLGRSVQAFGYLPEAENDSIFAIYAEKFGFIGVTLLLGLFLAFFARIKRVMERAPDDFSRLVATGALVWLATQSLINIGAMLGVLPLKGITLPFISYGGTSVVFVMALVGVVFQISRYTLYSVPRQSGDPMGPIRGVKTDVLNGRVRNEDTRYGRRVRGAYHPSSGSRT